MSRCEDFPCCGHELGCCPDFDSSGNQLNMICVCGAVLPLHNPVSICDACLDDGYDTVDYERDELCEEYDYFPDPDSDFF